MFFRNLSMARFAQESAAAIRDWAADGSLQRALEDVILKPVGPLELCRTGFVPPLGHDATALFHQSGSFIWLTLGSETRLLPPAVVRGELARRLAEMEKQEGRVPGGRTRRRIAEQVIADLLPKSHVKPGRTNAYLDLDNRMLFVDTSSRKAAEAFISEIRHALGSFPALPLNAEVAPRSVLTGWIAGKPLPTGIALGEECELKDASDQGAVIRCQRQDLASDEIARHLESGKQVTKLALTVDDHASFVIGEDLVVRKFKLLDGAIEQLDAGNTEDVKAELDARFILMTGEARNILSKLEPALKITA